MVATLSLLTASVPTELASSTPSAFASTKVSVVVTLTVSTPLAVTVPTLTVGGINVGSFYKNVNAEYMSRINSQSFAFSPNDGNENVIHPEVRKSFNQRKDARSNSKPLNEENVCQYLRFETFKNQQINTKRVIDTISKSVLKELNMLK